MNNAIYVSILLTFPTVLASAFVIYLWFPKVPKEAKHWLILGVALGFAGAIVDNTWWGIAWHLRRIGDPDWPWWFDHGIYSNIVFRQGFKLAAAYCHIKAAVIERSEEDLNWMFFWLIASSLVLCIVVI